MSMQHFIRYKEQADVPVSVAAHKEVVLSTKGKAGFVTVPTATVLHFQGLNDVHE